MAKDSFFCNLSSDRIEEIINRSNKYVCYAAPGIRSGPAAALKNAAERLGKDMVVVWIDFDEHVMRMGYGEIEAVKILQDAGFTLKEMIIREQYNCKATGYWKTNSVKYNFLLIAHEYLFVFRK